MTDKNADVALPGPFKKPARIYVASSWRNDVQPEVVRALRALGHEVYDFKNPRAGDHGFSWREIDPRWGEWTGDEFRKGLEHPVAIDGFNLDMEALRGCDACVLVLPCGRSAHLELGWAVGAGKTTAILLPEFGKNEPELMYRMVDALLRIDELAAWAQVPAEPKTKEGRTVLGKIDEEHPVPGAPAPINPETGQHGGHFVISAEERAKGHVRPVRTSYKHEKCGSVTTMPLAIGETYAREPHYYGKTFCCSCRTYLPVGEAGEFVWLDDGTKVGT